MNARTMERVEELLKEVTTPKEFDELEQVIHEAKGKYLGVSRKSFWADKSPCWEMCNCPDMIRSECPASKHNDTPCWEMEGTYCKLDDRGATGLDTSICQSCHVYKRWGGNAPIKITLFGKGINTSLERIG